ncbi:MAG: hypothetical protein ACFBSF_05695 [Leptolyngbyaceae cyanobacterium]
MAKRKLLLAIACVSGLALLPLSAVRAQAASYTLDFDHDASGDAVELNNLGISVGDWETPDSVNREDYVVSDQWLSDFGVSINAYEKPSDYSRDNNWDYDRHTEFSAESVRDLVVFDTNPASYSSETVEKQSFDKDLLTGESYGTEDQGHVLIMQSGNKDWHKPNDEKNGGVISFSFENTVDLTSIDLLDVDDYDNRGKQIIFTAYGEKDEAGKATVLNTWRFDEAALQSNRVTQLSKGTGDNSLYRFKFDQAGVKRLDALYPGSGAIAALQWEQDQDPPELPEPASALSLLAVAALRARLKRSQEVSDNA